MALARSRTVWAARAYGQDALILIRPDGYLGLIAHADDTQAVVVYLRSL